MLKNLMSNTTLWARSEVECIFSPHAKVFDNYFILYYEYHNTYVYFFSKWASFWLKPLVSLYHKFYWLTPLKIIES